MLSIIVPYRRRLTNLAALRECLFKRFENIEWEFIVVEQMDREPFNQGLLSNIGFKHSTGTDVCFHDADMIPIEADYSSVVAPTCLISECDLYGGGIPYPKYFGGVALFTRQLYEAVNGYSNRYTVWGKNDDDIRLRCERAGLQPQRRAGKFHHQDHPRDFCSFAENDEKWAAFRTGPHDEQWREGLSTAEFQLIETHRTGNELRLVVTAEKNA